MADIKERKIPAIQAEALAQSGKTDEFLPTDAVTTPQAVDAEVVLQRESIVNEEARQSEAEQNIPEFGNMTDAAIIAYLRKRPSLPTGYLVRGYTMEQWLFAHKFAMTPEKFEQYSGKAPEPGA